MLLPSKKWCERGPYHESTGSFVQSPKKGLLGYYFDAIRKAIERNETGMIRIQT